jgi:hypothetical protein
LEDKYFLTSKTKRIKKKPSTTPIPGKR